MKLGKATLLGAVGAAFISTNAMAADVPPMVVNTAPAAPPPVVVAQPGFDWAGPYVGVVGGALFEFPIAREFWIFGGQAGYNFAFGPNLLAGVEVRAGIRDDGDIEFEGALSTRLGYILGGNILAYAELGVETLAFNQWLWNAGGGVEVGIGRAMSVFGEAAVVGTFTGECCALVVLGGVNWHPGN